MSKRNEGWTWCCHHNRELEYCHDFAERVEHILLGKPKKEHAARLHEFQFVKHPERLPMPLRAAMRANGEARRAVRRARKAYRDCAVRWVNASFEKRSAAYERCERAGGRLDDAHQNAATAERGLHVALMRYRAAVGRQHRREVPDTTWNGVSIFPKDAP